MVGQDFMIGHWVRDRVGDTESVKGFFISIHKLQQRAMNDLGAVPLSFVQLNCLERGELLFFLLMLPPANASQLAFNRYFSQSQRTFHVLS